MEKTLNLIIVGAGGHAQVVYSSILAMQNPALNVLAFVDKDPKIASLMGLPVLPESEEIIEALKQDQALTHFAFGIGSVRAAASRLVIAQRFKSWGLCGLTVVHPSAVVDSSVQLAEAAFVGAGAVVQPFVQVGLASIINTAAVIEHHAQVAANCHIAPAAVLCGGVQVGDNSFIGANATVIQQISIGKNTTVGAGVTVIRNAGDDVLVL